MTTEPVKPMITIECKCECGASFIWECEDEFLLPYKPAHCPKCSDARNAEIEKRQAQDAADKIERLRKTLLHEIAAATPPRYQQTDVAHQGFNRAAWAKIKTWDRTDAKPWLGMVGPTGACKSRMAYLLASNYLQDTFTNDGGPSFEFVSAFEITEAVMQTFSDNAEVKHQARASLNSLRKCDLLVIDDLGKGRLTPAPAAELFALLDFRHARNRALIWTSNSTPQQIAATLPEDLGGPLAGRLLECSKIYSLK